MNNLIKMFKADYNFLLNELQAIQDSYVDAIDVRLCIDFDDSDTTWIIRSGDASYDQRHSMLCAASSIDRDSDASAVLEDLINQTLDQASESEIA
jgi:hypothetical protein